MKNKGKNKKVYSKPELEVVKVDCEISLVMWSPGGPDAELKSLNAAVPLKSTESSSSSIEIVTQSEALGGSSPF